MTRRISQPVIDELLSKTDVVEVIEEFLSLRKAGRNYTALCPFHNEKTPSFSVNREKQFYYCFGCGAGGSAINFLMNYLRLSFVEALSELADRAGMTLPSTDPETPRAPSADLYDILAQAAKHYAAQLRQRPAANRAVAYLKQRGLTGRVAADFDLGYAPPDWDQLQRALGTSPEALRALSLAGLVIAKPYGRYYDRFRDRIMFPIRDARGRIVGFGGRGLDGAEPKYLNSPETPIFHKGAELYGLHRALTIGADPQRLLVVEGYMDVIALAQFGINHVVATLGTALTRDHVTRLFRAVPEVILCFDGDEAGERAAWRSLNVILPQMKDGRTVGFLFLPAGEDPDSWVRKSGATLFETTDKVTALSEFLFASLLKRVNLSTPEGNARLVALANPHINLLPPGALQQLLRRRLGELSTLDADELTGLARTTRPAEQVVVPTRRPAPSIIQSAIAIILRRPELAMRVDLTQDLTGVKLPHMGIFLELVRLIQDHPALHCGALLERWRGAEESSLLNRLAAEDPLVSNEGLEAEFAGVMERLQALANKQRRVRLLTSNPGALTQRAKAELRAALAINSGAATSASDTLNE